MEKAKPAGGAKQYARIVEFEDRTTADEFRDAVLAALDEQGLT